MNAKLKKNDKDSSDPVRKLLLAPEDWFWASWNS